MATLREQLVNLQPVNLQPINLGLWPRYANNLLTFNLLTFNLLTLNKPLRHNGETAGIYIV
ncbi:MAG: hypothetical protein F6K56_46285, partial [Moorea sp. SIO3G5]|nr:hypothetical protein [Moorena sp. SIO3G5]